MAHDPVLVVDDASKMSDSLEEHSSYVPPFRMNLGVAQGYS